MVSCPIWLKSKGIRGTWDKHLPQSVGFRIQLGGLAAAAAAAAATSRQIAAANYARSDTSEELNVDGNDEDSNDGSHSAPSVSDGGYW